MLFFMAGWVGGGGEGVSSARVSSHLSLLSLLNHYQRPGGGVLPYIGYIGQCEAPKGIVFSAVWSEIGYQF